ncbi:MULTISPECIES: carboxylate-amine ligase [unclassified Kitasatospora]|uniref:carboxylate-amine ligase n=1 Tax=unclassified Kitasatospora TaxID=2633591 RepID=UPI0024744EB2|nr:glutamate--cysteine ligase [Kitasatospora sp. MAP12-44]
MLTLGVEEEYLLLDPLTGLPVPLTEKVRAAAGLQPALSEGEVQPELLQAQLEIATPVCRELAEVGGHLLRLRLALGEAAQEVGCCLAACGAAPFAGLEPQPVTESARYRALHSDAPQLIDEQLINGMHVHVGVPNRAAGVLVLNRLRPWLPLLVALSANSPFWQGHDTGFASWRTLVFGRWPITGVPPLFADARDYDCRIRALQEARMIRDTGQLYWQARLSERYPTVEVRAMDVQLRADDAVMLAGMVRALAVTALRDEECGRPVAVHQPERLAAAGWHAARYGITDGLHDPVTGRLRKAGDVLTDLVDHLLPALRAADDARQVISVLHRMLRDGNGAEQQRRTARDSGREGLLTMITEQTAAACEPYGR